MTYQTVNFSANEISWILLLTNERMRKIIYNDSIRLNKIQFFLHLYPTIPSSSRPCPLTMLVYWKNKQIDISFLCVCPLIDDDFRHNTVKIAVDPLSKVSYGSTAMTILWQKPSSIRGDWSLFVNLTSSKGSLFLLFSWFEQQLS